MPQYHAKNADGAGLATCGQTAIRSPGLPFDGLHPCNYNCYSFTDPKAMEGWVGTGGRSAYLAKAGIKSRYLCSPLPLYPRVPSYATADGASLAT